MGHTELELHFKEAINSTINELHYLKHSLKISELHTEDVNKNLEVNEVHFVISEDPNYQHYSQHDVDNDLIIERSINLYICYIYSLRETKYRCEIAKYLGNIKPSYVQIDEFQDLGILRNNILHKYKKWKKINKLEYIIPKDKLRAQVNLKLYIKLCVDLKKSLSNYLDTIQNTMQITKSFTFNAGHRLQHYDGICSNVHGHNFKVEVTLTGQIDYQGMVFDFKDMKPIQQWIDSHRDHAFIYQEGDSIGEYLTSQGLKTYSLTTPPSSEHLCLELISQLEKHYQRAQQITTINMRETPKCSATRKRSS